MNTTRLSLVLTLVNLALLVVLLAGPGTAAENAAVLRGRGLEIVDDHGRVRASIAVLPADPDVKMPDGSRGYPETVLLRLIDSRGGPHVKLATMENGSALLLGGEANPTHVQVLAQGGDVSLKLNSHDGQVRLIRP